MDSSPLIPQSPRDLTTSWLSTVLAHIGAETAVSSVTSSPVGTGQMASSVRLQVEYDDNSAGLPASFVVKLASEDPNSRGAGARGAYLREVRFYQILSESSKAATPVMWWADINVETSDFGLLLEDMHPAEQGDQIAGCTPEQVRAAAINIAGLHAPSWNDEAMYDHDWLTVPRGQGTARHEELQEILAAATPGFIDRYAGRITNQHKELLTWFSNYAAEYLDNGDGNVALMHGDHRLDNLLFNANDSQRPVTVVDWQTVSVRNPLADISYLLGTSVTPELRREIEHEIVTDYHRQLCALGVSGYTQEACFDDYRGQSLHALILTVLGSMLTIQTSRGDDMFMAMLHRCSQLIFDLDAR